ncbi:MAG TPA: glycerophosphodiester phosphodiesterase family protein, partial [Stellaceae bacterium]|nr:glycerophosphodiester phosphodiesterase family protein [Stellaceae bacterium]
MTDVTAGVFISYLGRRVRLKWHKLRRDRADPPFGLANLRAGLAAGASLEIDIRALADGAFVCLHDDVLDGETDGHGRVGEADTAAIRGLRISGTAYAPPLLSDIARELAAAPNSSACLQLDLKEKREGLSLSAIEAFVATIGPVAQSCLLSGTDWHAVEALGAAVPSLRLGFDPLDLAKGRDLADRAAIAAFLEEVAATAPGAAGFYLNYRFVLRALAHGINPVPRLQQGGALVDIWTLDPTTPEICDVLEPILATGADQITTN